MIIHTLFTCMQVGRYLDMSYLIFHPHLITKSSTLPGYLAQLILFFHPTHLANFPPYLFIWPYFFMKFTQNINPTRLLGPTCLIGT